MWRVSVTEVLTASLRLIARSCLIFNAILAALFSVWLTWKVCFRLMDLLDPWLAPVN